MDIVQKGGWNNFSYHYFCKYNKNNASIAKSCPKHIPRLSMCQFVFYWNMSQQFCDRKMWQQFFENFFKTCHEWLSAFFLRQFVFYNFFVTKYLWYFSVKTNCHIDNQGMCSGRLFAILQCFLETLQDFCKKNKSFFFRCCVIFFVKRLRNFSHYSLLSLLSLQ